MSPPAAQAHVDKERVRSEPLSSGRQQNWLLEAPTVRGTHAYQKELSRVPPRSSCTSARRRIMAKQIVMDATGDTQHEFNPTDAAALKEAERRFKELTG